MGVLGYAAVVLLTAVAVAVLPGWLAPQLETNIRGSVAPGWEKVEQQFRSLVESRAERGGSFSVYYRGERVVNLVGGYADGEAGLPWTEETVGQFYSTTKGVSAVVIAMLVERGHLAYEKRVKDYWPEFAVNGKEEVTVEQLVSHQAGLPVLDVDITSDDIKQNTEKLSQALANQKPVWTPGSVAGYHTLTLGMYMDQLVRRVDPEHRSLSQFLKEELATPLGLDFVIGLPRSESWRYARVVEPGLLDLLGNPSMWSLISGLIKGDTLFAKSIKFVIDYKDTSPVDRETPLASAMGFGTSESVAKLYGILANGGQHKGISYLSPESVQRLNTPVISCKDEVLGCDSTYGPGTALFPNPNNSSLTFGTPGSGGQMGYGDPRYRLGWAYLTNYHSMVLVETNNYLALKKAMYDTVFELEKKAA